MKSLAFEDWDGGRVRVNLAYADLLRRHRLTTYQALAAWQPSAVAKDLRQERVTVRVELQDEAGPHAFYLKRHGPPPWKEYLKPILRLRRPILGARHEWDAILRFHEIGIPTMTPVALGISGRYSCLLTAALDGCQKLSEWKEPESTVAVERRRIVDDVAQIARTMHGAGLHHQDFYLGHLLVPESGRARDVHVIDLGRVQKWSWLGQRWIIKDLAQLHYSAKRFTLADRLRFLRAYFNRPVTRTDLPFLHAIERKSQAIGRHSRKNRL